MTDTEKALYLAMAKLTMHAPWFGLMLRHFKLEVAPPGFPTIGVQSDGTGLNLRMKLLYNPEFLAKLSQAELQEILKHEVLHPALSHTRKETSGIRWNIAQDLAINSLLDRSVLEPLCLRIGGCLPGVGEFKDMPEKKSAEWYHANLPDDIEQKYGGGFDEHLQLSPEAQEKLREIIKETTDHVSQMGQWGETSAEIRSAIQNYLKGYDWRRELENIITRTRDLEILSTRRKVNKRLPHAPGAIRKRVPRVLVAIDESGSVGPDLWTMLASALASLSLHATFDLLPFDYGVAADRLQSFKKGRPATFGRTLTGGTNFDAPTAFFNEHSKNYDVLFIATDGEAPAPRECDKKRIWIVPEGRALMFATNERVIYVR